MPQQKMVICAYAIIGQTKAAANRSASMFHKRFMKKVCLIRFKIRYRNHCMGKMPSASVDCLIKKVISAQSLDKRFQLCIAAERHLKLSARFSGFLIGGT